MNSLAHRRVREIAKRIDELSAVHQVIVFTHDIWFASELLAAFDAHPSACSGYTVREYSGLKGLISGEKHPRSDTVQRIGRRINEKVQEAEGGSDDGRQERIDSTYDYIRTWCERAVEHELLKRVAQRFQPNVAMQNLTDIHADRLGTAIGTIYPIWENACRYMTGHSQPLDTLGVRRSIGELKQDWADLQQTLKDYKSDESRESASPRVQAHQGGCRRSTTGLRPSSIGQQSARPLPLQGRDEGEGGSAASGRPFRQSWRHCLPDRDEVAAQQSGYRRHRLALHSFAGCPAARGRASRSHAGLRGPSSNGSVRSPIVRRSW
ncbi:MAG: hypothetical protein ACRDZR_11270 [Acidimicrobiales bacterium]